MKRFLLTPIFKTFKRRTFFSSLEQNNCPVYDAEEVKKQAQKEAIKKLYLQNLNRNLKVTFNDVKPSCALYIPTNTFINVNFLRLILFDKLNKML